jgi:ribosome-binding ATPase
MLIGVVGKPNVGKSTFFRAATLAEALIGNYPFATIEPNHGTAFVKIKDSARDFEKVSNPREGYVHGKSRFVPMELIDVAGLVPGASEGKGMGNKFLDDLSSADALIHVIDVSGSTNEKGESVEKGAYNPVNDIKFLEEELDTWIYQIMERGWAKFARQAQLSGTPSDRAIAEHFSGIKINLGMVKKAFNTSELSNKLTEWSEEDMKKFASELRKQAKPIIIAANKMDVSTSKANLERIRTQTNSRIIPSSAEFELALREANKAKLIDYIPGENHFEIKGTLTDKQKEALAKVKKFLETNKSTGVQDILNTIVFEVLEYIAIHPGGVSKLEDSKGNVLPDCFLMPKDSTALDFAYRLHSDFGDKFIRAVDVRTKQTVGKEHKLKHLDIIEIIAGK